MKKINNLFSEKEWNQLIKEVEEIQSGHPYLRFGQCLWNIAYEKKPNVVERLRATQADPFYTAYNIHHEKVQAFKDEIVDYNK